MGQGASALPCWQPSALTILTGRDVSKVKEAIKSLPCSQYSVAYRLVKLDLACIQSIREAAATVVGYAEPTIDIVINNAGVMNIPRRTLSPDGVELHLATNHLGHILFVDLIKAKLSGARIVIVTSNKHALSPIRLSDYNFDGKELPEEERPPRAACETFGVPWGVGYLPLSHMDSLRRQIFFTPSKCLNDSNRKELQPFPLIQEVCLSFNPFRKCYQGRGF